MFDFCIDTAKSGKVTRQKNIKKGSPKNGLPFTIEQN